MKKNNIPRFMLILLAMLSFGGLFGQVKKKEDKNTVALNALKSTEFYVEYKKLKDRIENKVAQFHSDMKEKNLSHEDIEKVAVAYENSIAKFGNLLNTMKTDMAKSEFAKKPDLFTKSYGPQLNRAYSSFKNGCELQIERLTGSGHGGAFVMEDVEALLSLGGTFSDAIVNNKSRVSKMSADFLEKNFIQELRFKLWEEY